MNDIVRTLVVLGIDRDGKPHAAWFVESDAEAVIGANQLSGFHAVRLAAPELQAAAAELPAGKVLSSGKLSVPLVKRDLYDRFAVLIGTDAELASTETPAAAKGDGTAGDHAPAAAAESGSATAAAAAPSADVEGAAVPAGDDVSAAAASDDTWQPVTDAGPTIPDPWAALAVGSIVLASIGRDDGWWEAVVLAVEPTGDSLQLSWRDWPRMPSFRAARQGVSILGSSAR